MFGFIRNRTFLTLVALLLAGTLVGAIHNNASRTGAPFLISDLSTSITAPVTFGSHYLAAAGGWVSRVGRSRGTLLRENAALCRKVERLTKENARLREAADENRGLREALGLKAVMPTQSIAAEVIAREESNWFDTATLSVGRTQGVRKGAAVVSARGLVGQVIRTDPYTCQIAMLSDIDSGVGAIDQRSRSSGIIRGQGETDLVFAFLPKDADVRVGDTVVSSGLGRVVPKGLVIGKVLKVQRNSIAGTTSALVRPAVSVDELEHVFVVNPGQAVP